LSGSHHFDDPDVYELRPNVFKNLNVFMNTRAFVANLVWPFACKCLRHCFIRLIFNDNENWCILKRPKMASYESMVVVLLFSIRFCKTIKLHSVLDSFSYKKDLTFPVITWVLTSYSLLILCLRENLYLMHSWTSFRVTQGALDLHNALVESTTPRSTSPLAPEKNDLRSIADQVSDSCSVLVLMPAYGRGSSP